MTIQTQLPGAAAHLHGIFAKLEALGIFDQPQVDLYEEGLADFYDKFADTFVSDIPVLQAMIARPTLRCLDLACGSGRISIALARAGHHVDGLELSDAMLALAARRIGKESADVQSRLRLFKGDMTAFALGEKYDAVILGITSVSLLLGSADRRALFEQVRAHLAPGGRFIFDFIDLDGDRWKSLDGYLDVWSREDDEGVDFAIVGQRFYPLERRFSFNVFREIVAWSGETRRTIGSSVKAWVERGEFEEELAATGFTVVDERRQDISIFLACEVSGS